MGRDGSPTTDGWIFTSAKGTAHIWAQALECKEQASPWRSATSDALELQCETYTGCRVSGHQVLSCMDPKGTHEWRGQRLSDIPADCVSPEQQTSLPDQPACNASQLGKEQRGMDLLWEFFSQYQRAETR